MLSFSTQEAASKVGISYITLRRWLAAKNFRPSMELGISGGKTIWRFSAQDIDELREYKKLAYCKGRGSAGSLHSESRMQKNYWKEKKRRIAFVGKRNPLYRHWVAKMKKERASMRKARKMFLNGLRELGKLGLRPVWDEKELRKVGLQPIPIPEVSEQSAPAAGR